MKPLPAYDAEERLMRYLRDGTPDNPAKTQAVINRLIDLRVADIDKWRSVPGVGDRLEAADRALTSMRESAASLEGPISVHVDREWCSLSSWRRWRLRHVKHEWKANRKDQLKREGRVEAWALERQA